MGRQNLARRPRVRSLALQSTSPPAWPAPSPSPRGCPGRPSTAKARTPRPGSRPAAARAARAPRAPRRWQPRLSPAPQHPHFPPRRAAGAARGLPWRRLCPRAPTHSNATFSLAPPERKTGNMRLLAPFLDWSERVLQDTGNRNKLLFSAGFTSMTSFGYINPRRGTFGACVVIPGKTGSAKVGTGARLKDGAERPGPEIKARRPRPQPAS